MSTNEFRTPSPTDGPSSAVSKGISGSMSIPNASDALMFIDNVSKWFGAVHAVTDITIWAYSGEITAIVGDNGAGKSTLIKCIAGVHTPTSGRIMFGGVPVHFSSPEDARRAGIETVYQTLALVDDLTIWQNMFLNRERVKRFGPLSFLDRGAMQRDWSSDSLYGSKHLAEKWRQDGTSKQIRALLLADMIGDSDLNIEQDGNSSLRLQMIAFAAASHYGYQSHFYGRQTAIEDDHLPFAKAGIPVMDFIDLDYGYNNSFHHTPEDTLDKLSAKSLEISGNAMLGTLALLNAGAK